MKRTPPSPEAVATDAAPSPSNNLEGRLRALVSAELNGTSRFRSRYDAALAILRLCAHEDMPQNAFCNEQRRVAQAAYSRFTTPLKAPPAGFQARPERRLVRSMSAADANKTFDALTLVTKMLGVGGSQGDGGLMTLTYQVVLLDFAERVGQTRHDALDGILDAIELQVKLWE